MISEKKNILQTDSRGKNLARKYMALHVGEKILSPEVWKK